MIIYICNFVRGTIRSPERETLAKHISDIHCAVAGTLPERVHTLFFDDAPREGINGKSLLLFGNSFCPITRAMRRELVARIARVVCESAHLHPQEVTIDVSCSSIPHRVYTKVPNVVFAPYSLTKYDGPLALATKEKPERAIREQEGKNTIPMMCILQQAQMEAGEVAKLEASIIEFSMRTFNAPPDIDWLIVPEGYGFKGETRTDLLALSVNPNRVLSTQEQDILMKDLLEICQRAKISNGGEIVVFCRS